MSQSNKMKTKNKTNQGQKGVFSDTLPLNVYCRTPYLFLLNNKSASSNVTAVVKYLFIPFWVKEWEPYLGLLQK